MGLTRDRRGFAVLLRYTSGATLARMADEGARVALVLFATSGHGGTAFGGLLVAGLMVPHVVAAPLAGRLADGVRRRRPLYTAALLVYAGTLIGAAVSVPISRLLTFGLVVLAGCVAPLMIGGLTSLIGEILPEHSSRAYGWDSATYGLAGIAGPALAAIVAGVLDATWSLIALGGVAVLASVLVGGLPIPERLPPGPGGRPAKVPLSAAVTVLWRRRRLGAVTVGSTMNVLGLGALPLVAVLLAGRVENPMLTG